MEEQRNAWVIMSFGSDAGWQGSPGYADDIPTSYQHNSQVPDSRRVKLGDALIIRSRATIPGFAKVEGIVTELGTVQMRRCPQCGTPQLRERISLSPDYRCSNSHEFDRPTSETAPCTWYTIRYAQSFTPVIPPTDAQLLVPAYLNVGA